LHVAEVSPLIHFFETVQGIATFFLLFCGYIYYRQLKRKRLEKKVSAFENVMYLLTGLSVFLFASSFLLLFLDALFEGE
jgi:hypothetical protein